MKSTAHRINRFVASLSIFAMVATSFAPLPALATTTIFSDNFSGGISQWTKVPASAKWSHDGSAGNLADGSARAKGDTGSSNDNLTAKFAASGSLGYEGLAVSFSYRAGKIVTPHHGAPYVDDGLEDGDNDYVRPEWTTNGSTWTPFPASYIIDDTKDDGQWHDVSYALPVSASNQLGFNIRFASHLDSDSDKVWIDDVLVSGNVLVAPKLKVRKVVINDNGGTKGADDFGFTISQPDMADVHATTSAEFQEFTIGTATFAVVEDETPGYRAEYQGCSLNTDAEYGQVYECTITNDDLAPSLTLIKHVEGETDAVPADFQLTLASVASPSASPVPQNSPIMLSAGTYTVGEDAVAGFTPTFSGACDESGNVVLTVGENPTCIVTNTYSAQPTQSSETIVVRAEDLGAAYTDSGKWYLYNDETDVTDNTLGSFVSGPATAPAGDGSAQISVSGSQRRNLATSRYGGVMLADITSLKYSTYNPSAGNGGSANRSGYLQFNVDFTGANTWQRRLVFLPSDNGSITQDAWQEWDAINGGTALWRYSGSTWPVTGQPGSTPKTWNQILSDYPSVRTLGTGAFLGIRVGEPYPDGYTENLDKVVVGIKTGLNTHTTTFDFEPTPPSTVSVCKLNEHQQPQSGWQVMLLGNHVGSVTVPADGAVHVSDSLASGSYVFIANGTYSYRPSDPNATDADAAFSKRQAGEAGYYTGNTLGAYAPWANGNTFAAPWTGYLSLLVGGQTVHNWGDIFNTNHRYAQAYATAGGPVDFRILDSAYGDNSGILTVDIYEGHLGTTGGENGCAVFNNVPRGGYKVDEIQQDGWTNVSGLDAVTVDEAQETFTIVNDGPDPIAATVNVCKLDEDEVPQAGWRVMLLGEKLETVTVPAYSGSGTPIAVSSSTALTSGESYVLVAHGTYWANDGITADAKYSVRAPNTTWTDLVQNYESYGAELLDLQVNGASPDWGSYFSGHTYAIPFTGTGSAVAFTLNDVYPQNNEGSLTVDIYPGYLGTTGGEDGCATFEGVPLGNYTVDEVQQDGWTNMSGLTSVAVESSQETFTIVNDGPDPVPTPSPTVSGQKFSDHNGDGQKGEEDAGLADWTINAYEYVETLTVPASDSAGLNSSELPAGEYLAAATGTWENRRSPLNLVDTEYSTEDTWASHMDGFTGYGDGILELQIAQQFGNWGAYTDSHAYARTFTSSGGTVNFRIFDGDAASNTVNPSWYGDNYGSLTVKLYRFIGTDTTDGYGNYSIDISSATQEVLVCEAQQEGWVQTYPAAPGCHSVVPEGQPVSGLNFGNHSTEVVQTQYLEVTPVCSNEEEGHWRWRIYNPNDFPLAFDWTISSGPGESGYGIVPAGESVYIETGEHPGEQLMVQATVPSGDEYGSTIPFQTSASHSGSVGTCDGEGEVSPLLRVRKVVVNGAFGELASSDFSLYVDSILVTHNQWYTIAAGDHDITESPNLASYVASYDEACWQGGVSLSSGDEATCTITNTYQSDEGDAEESPSPSPEPTNTTRNSDNGGGGGGGGIIYSPTPTPTATPPASGGQDGSTGGGSTPTPVPPTGGGRGGQGGGVNDATLGGLAGDELGGTSSASATPTPSAVDDGSGNNQVAAIGQLFGASFPWWILLLILLAILIWWWFFRRSQDER